LFFESDVEDDISKKTRKNSGRGGSQAVKKSEKVRPGSVLAYPPRKKCAGKHQGSEIERDRQGNLSHGLTERDARVKRGGRGAPVGRTAFGEENSAEHRIYITATAVGEKNQSFEMTIIVNIRVPYRNS